MELKDLKITFLFNFLSIVYFNYSSSWMDVINDNESNFLFTTSKKGYCHLNLFDTALASISGISTSKVRGDLIETKWDSCDNYKVNVSLCEKVVEGNLENYVKGMNASTL